MRIRVVVRSISLQITLPAKWACESAPSNALPRMNYCTCKSAHLHGLPRTRIRGYTTFEYFYEHAILRTQIGALKLAAMHKLLRPRICARESAPSNALPRRHLLRTLLRTRFQALEGASTHAFPRKRICARVSAHGPSRTRLRARTSTHATHTDLPVSWSSSEAIVDTEEVSSDSDGRRIPSAPGRHRQGAQVGQTRQNGQKLEKYE